MKHKALKMRSLANCLAPLLLIAAAHPAKASGSLACTIEGKAITLNLEGSFSHGVGEGLMTAGGTLELRSDAVRTTKITLEREKVTQYWLTGPDLKLRIYHEPAEGEHEEIDLVIEARIPKGSSSDEPTYKGTYVAHLVRPADNGEAKTETLKGPVVCSAGY